MSSTRERGRAAQTYLEHELQNVDPLSLVARLYEMAALEVARARAALVTGSPAAMGTAVRRAIDCISLLQSSLDMDQGGEVARNLDRLYAYLLRRLSQAHVGNDDAALAEVGGHLTDLGRAWREVASRGSIGVTAVTSAVAAAAR
jgi:flagellar protein FliS